MEFEANYSGFQRIVTGFLAIVLIFSAIFSFLYLIRHTNHHCLGKECQICSTLKSAQHHLKKLTPTPPSPTFFSIINSILLGVVLFFLKEKWIPHATLVCQKIQMNN